MAFGRKHPPATYYTCQQCGEKLSPESKTTARRVEGWVAPRAGGGANHIRYQKNTGEYCHLACLDELHQAVKLNQESLF